MIGVIIIFMVLLITFWTVIIYNFIRLFLRWKITRRLEKLRDSGLY